MNPWRRISSRTRSLRTASSSVIRAPPMQARFFAKKSWELAQKAHVILEKDLDIVDSVLQHGQTVHAHSEREAVYFFGVVVDEAVDGGIDHTRAEEFDPAGAFAFCAGDAGSGGAAAAAENTGNIKFHRRFRERKITGTKTRVHAGAEELFDEIFDGAGEIAKRDVGIDSQTFDLMEREGVRGIGIVAAIDLARHDDAHRRLLFFHGADLHRRGVGAKEKRSGRTLGQIDVEGVHVVADGMKFRNVEGFEIVVGRFDFGAFDDGEADGDEDVFDFLEDLADQVMRTDGALY